MKLYLILDRSGRMLFEQPEVSAGEAIKSARSRDPRSVTAFLKTPYTAQLVGASIPINTIGQAIRHRL